MNHHKILLAPKFLPTLPRITRKLRRRLSNLRRVTLEEQILNNIELVTKNKTTIIVSHRISSAKNADTIIVLNDGIITHEAHTPYNLDIEGFDNKRLSTS